ncbi:MAG TPA: hypothetical protein VGI81_04085 [Tepidisphaeraceae bacterium]|jgi:hypothetical protein
MSERDDEQFDAMLSGFFQETLDPQRGRAERGFRRHLDEVARSAWRMRTWVIGAFATGMAASVAMLWAVPLILPAHSGSSQPGVRIAQGTPAPDVIPNVERVVQTHTTDEGVMVLGDDSPVRVLRRQQLDQTRWTNDRHDVQREQSTPQDEWVFIKMPTY